MGYPETLRDMLVRMQNDVATQSGALSGHAAEVVAGMSSGDAAALQATLYAICDELNALLVTYALPMEGSSS